jgi:hypothetical protein
MTEFAMKSTLLDLTTHFKNCPVALNNKTVSVFWQWGFSDLLQNTTRGILAEYIVAVLLGVDGKPRNPWESFDLRLNDGRTIEIKTMSRLQAWAQKQLSEPRVVIRPSRYWSAKTGIMEKTPSLNADLYIICYFTAEEHSTANPLDLDQWEFFVLDKNKVKDVLKKTKSISLKTLKNYNIKSLKADDLAFEIVKVG